MKNAARLLPFLFFSCSSAPEFRYRVFEYDEPALPVVMLDTFHIDFNANFLIYDGHKKVVSCNPVMMNQGKLEVLEKVRGVEFSRAVKKRSWDSVDMIWFSDSHRHDTLFIRFVRSTGMFTIVHNQHIPIYMKSVRLNKIQASKEIRRLMDLAVNVAQDRPFGDKGILKSAKIDRSETQVRIFSSKEVALIRGRELFNHNALPLHFLLSGIFRSIAD